jgi:hypothetical protein
MKRRERRVLEDSRRTEREARACARRPAVSVRTWASLTEECGRRRNGIDEQGSHTKESSGMATGGGAVAAERSVGRGVRRPGGRQRADALQLEVPARSRASRSNDDHRFASAAGDSRAPPRWPARATRDSRSGSVTAGRCGYRRLSMERPCGVSSRCSTGVRRDPGERKDLPVHRAGGHALWLRPPGAARARAHRPGSGGGWRAVCLCRARGDEAESALVRGARALRPVQASAPSDVRVAGGARAGSCRSGSTEQRWRSC